MSVLTQQFLATVFTILVLRSRFAEASKLTLAPAIGATSDADQWHSISWKVAQRHVVRLQRRIAKAFREGKMNKVKCLQRILTRSHYAHFLAVRRVTSSKGGRTPGVDQVLWNTPTRKWLAVLDLKRVHFKNHYKALPLRRVYIPKKNGKRRPLGIPVLLDRACQALYALALEPISESSADPDSYGFRRFRSTADAIEQVFICLSTKNSAQWILEGDIKACFDGISHQWLQDNIPIEGYFLNQWLKAGFIDQHKLFPTVEGTPQGGVISPSLCNMALDGLQAQIKSVAKRHHKVNFIRYADDFVVTCDDKDFITSHILPVIKSFLAQRGLMLSEEKTKITHIDEGFDFLGQNVRKYNGKLLIKPSKGAIKSLLTKVRDISRECRGHNAEVLVRRLNPVLRGWANYHRHVASKATFSYVDYHVHRAILGWAKRTHPKKGLKWIYQKYFHRSAPERGAIFTAKIKVDGNAEWKPLYKVASTKIVRRVKIRKGANPFDPTQTSYFAIRKKHKGVRDSGNSWKRHKQENEKPG